MSVFFEPYNNTGLGADFMQFGGEQLNFMESMSKAYDAQVYGSNVDTYVTILGEELQPVVDAINEREETKIQNPSQYFGMTDSMGSNDRVRERALTNIFSILGDNPDRYPEFQGMTRETLEQSIIDRGLKAVQQGQEDASNQTGMGVVGGFVGTMGGVLTDDSLIESLIITGPVSLGFNSSQALGKTMLREAIIGAGLEAQLQAGVMDWYNTLGLDYTYEDFFKMVALGGTIGAAFPVALTGVAKGAKFTTDQVKSGIQAFKGKGINAKDADAVLDQIDDFEALNTDVPTFDAAPQNVADDLFLPDTPEFVTPVRNEASTVILEKEVSDAVINQPFNTVDELYEIAPALQSKLEAVGQKIGDALGVKFKSPGLKLKSTTLEKIGRKALMSPRGLTDVVRGGFVATSPKQADEIVVALAKDFDVLDEGWVRTPMGYFDRKVLIKTEEGLIGEVQIWSESLLNAKEKKGTALYTKWRSAKTKAGRWLLAQRMKKLYAQALKGENTNYVTLAGILSDPKLRENLSSNSALVGTTDAVVNTSNQSTGTQSPSGSSSAIAVSESTNIAGLRSQDANTVSNSAIDLPPENIVNDPAGNVDSFLTHSARADEATAKLQLGKLPDDPLETTQATTLPEVTKETEANIDLTVEQIARDTDFETLADDEVLYFDKTLDDEVVPDTMTGAQVKAELAQDQQMLNRLEGCVT